MLPLPFVLATQNADKAREIVEIFVRAHRRTTRRVLARRGSRSSSTGPTRSRRRVGRLPQLAAPPDVEETGTTLEENARIKAGALADALGLLAVADDTGLGGRRARRCTGRVLRPLRRRARNVRRQRREAAARARTASTTRRARRASRRSRWRAGPTGREIAVRGRGRGRHRAPHRPAGAGSATTRSSCRLEGDGRTFAEMTPDEKHAISHRGRAFRALADALDEEG